MRIRRNRTNSGAGGDWQSGGRKGEHPKEWLFFYSADFFFLRDSRRRRGRGGDQLESELGSSKKLGVEIERNECVCACACVWDVYRVLCVCTQVQGESTGHIQDQNEEEN